VPGGTSRLLSPQHWAQEIQDHVPKKDGICCITNSELVILKWNQLQFTKTIQLEPNGSNVGTMWSAPAYSVANNAVEHIKVHYTNLSFNSEIIEVIHPDPYPLDSDMDGLTIEPLDGMTKNDNANVDFKDKKELVEYNPKPIQEQLKDAPNGVIPINHQETINQLDLIRWHVRLGHLQMNKVQRLASQGMLPSNIAKCKIPLCQSCIYGTMTKSAWRTKERPSTIATNIVLPGQHISVDQMESPIPGLIGQLKGKPTLARYRCATIFVNTFSRIGYIYLQQTTNAEETLESKRAFEVFARSHGVQVLHYHSNNGRFIENEWQNHAKLAGQTVSYAGVGAHHQNGIAEKRIRDLQDLACASLIHAIRRWPDVIDTYLWLYALRKANNTINISLSKDQTLTPIELFSKAKVAPILNSNIPLVAQRMCWMLIYNVVLKLQNGPAGLDLAFTLEARNIMPPMSV
jgi:GAG-pre-integrase domain